jgi:hypothetical protein
MRTIHDEDVRLSYWKEWKRSRAIPREVLNFVDRSSPHLWEEPSDNWTAYDYNSRR